MGIRAHFILYVMDQAKSTNFYSKVLAYGPQLNVPGMTEFQLGESCVLGLMPCAGIRNLLGENLPDPSSAVGIPRAELYLVREDAIQMHQRALAEGAKEISPMLRRDWGDTVGYSVDIDGHVLACCLPSPPIP